MPGSNPPSKIGFAIQQLQQKMSDHENRLTMVEQEADEVHKLAQELGESRPLLRRIAHALDGHGGQRPITDRILLIETQQTQIDQQRKFQKQLAIGIIVAIVTQIIGILINYTHHGP